MGHLRGSIHVGLLVGHVWLLVLQSVLIKVIARRSQNLVFTGSPVVSFDVVYLLVVIIVFFMLIFSAHLDAAINWGAADEDKEPEQV